MTAALEPWGDNRLVPTLSGRWIDPFDLKASDIMIEDMPHPMAFQARYGGATKWHYSNAQHSCVLALLVPDRLKFPAIAHDVVEAFLMPDQLGPLKRDPGMAAWRAAETQGQDAVADRLGLPRKFHEDRVLKHWHQRLYATEMLQLKDQEVPGVQPVPGLKLEKWLPDEAAARFVDAFFSYWTAHENG